MFDKMKSMFKTIKNDVESDEVEVIDLPDPNPEQPTAITASSALSAHLAAKRSSEEVVPTSEEVVIEEPELPELEDMDDHPGYLGTLGFENRAIFLDPIQIGRSENPEDLSLDMFGMWDVWVLGEGDEVEEVRLTIHGEGDLDEGFTESLVRSTGRYKLVNVGNVGVDRRAVLITDPSALHLVNYMRDVEELDGVAQIVDGGAIVKAPGNGSFPVSVLMRDGEPVGVSVSMYDMDA